jgi:hypothetical protein
VESLATYRADGAPRHRYLKLDEPAGDCRAVTVSTWCQPVNTRGPEHAGRACLSLAAGPFRLTLSPSVAQLRALALILTATADEQEMADAGLVPGAAGNELSYAVARMVQGGAA